LNNEDWRGVGFDTLIRAFFIGLIVVVAVAAVVVVVVVAVVAKSLRKLVKASFFFRSNLIGDWRRVSFFRDGRRNMFHILARVATVD